MEEKDHILAIVMATMMEAKPFVHGMGLVNIEQKPFSLFRSGNIFLIISDIGKANAAMAAAYCCHKLEPNCIFNLGSAGATDASVSLGEVFHIIKIIENDRLDLISGTPCVHEPDVLKGFKTAMLSTTDKAILNPEERKDRAKIAGLVDMEGAAIVQAAKLFETRCYIFKFVSDTPKHTQGEEIIKNIRLFRSSFFEFFRDSVLPAAHD